MRIAIAVLLVAGAARADVAVGALRAPHTPLGAACDAALARAQEEFARGSGMSFHVREHTVVGEYSWSDMCGVWGEYTVTLAPDARSAQVWSWRETRRPENANDDQAPLVERDGRRRAHGWRASFRLRGDDLVSGPGAYFVEVFQPAVEICLDAAAR
jgi:hypothetical protein